ncbi:MAG: PadR family transcriptional regulator [Chloroflexi bacterium]|nr:PadR family transcriptional regulator [Chloroflexota bacterium]
MNRVFHGFREEGPFRRGDLKFVILDMISEQPQHGYEIIRILEERSHGSYAPSAGVVYPTLQLLEEMGYIAGTQQDAKKVYSITDEGRRYLAENKDFTERVKKHMGSWWGLGVRYGAHDMWVDMGELQDEMKLLQKSIAHRVWKTDPEKVKRIREVVSRAHTDIRAILAE